MLSFETGASESEVVTHLTAELLDLQRNGAVGIDYFLFVENPTASAVAMTAVHLGDPQLRGMPWRSMSEDEPLQILCKILEMFCCDAPIAPDDKCISVPLVWSGDRTPVEFSMGADVCFKSAKTWNDRFFSSIEFSIPGRTKAVIRIRGELTPEELQMLNLPIDRLLVFGGDYLENMLLQLADDSDPTSSRVLREVLESRVLPRSTHYIVTHDGGAECYLASPELVTGIEDMPLAGRRVSWYWTDSSLHQEASDSFSFTHTDRGPYLEIERPRVGRSLWPSWLRRWQASA